MLITILSCSCLGSTREDAKEDESLDDAEVVVVPLNRERRPSFSFGLADDLVPPPFEQHPFFRVRPWDAPAGPAGDEVNDFMTQMQDMLKEMRKQLTDLIQHHQQHHPDGTEVGTRIGEDDLPQNKSTSTTKVIDGHVVTVNETTFSSGDDNIGAVFRIKVVEVKPSESPDVDTELLPEGSPEIEDKSGEPKAPEPTTSKSELEEDKHEETNEIPNQKVLYEWSDDIDPSFNEIEGPNYVSEGGEEFSVDSFTPNKKENYYDLSSDIDVNDYVSEHADRQGLVMIDPDAEFVETDPNSYYHYDRVPQRLQRFTN
ncbi:hypothetical protein J6590_025295 [Homalodisca vitripennis]|nr:hypothetical protein J6590_025295 [Homalodisca vitripennis]